ncbi:membrane protein [Rodentibacter pneumotropicus]|uniref:Membrane protein n=1 Tax=Rodentibacter pneumotropicus TaxID=758 RepID=A0A448MSA1_9PAST|nr:membrane protein [Rodentibacter pneumotropicus]
MQGKFDFNARDGELLGLNLLDLATQYFPINYNDELLQGKSMNTAYQAFTSSLSLENNLLTVNKISLKTPVLLGEGNGAIDLHTMQCDINLKLSATNEKYQNLKLPIRFLIAAIRLSTNWK